MSNEIPDHTAHRRHWFWWVVLAALLVTACADQAYRIVVQKRTEVELATLKSQGFPINVFDLELWHPAPADKDNAAVRILEAADYLELPRNGINTEKFPTRREPLAAEERETLRGILTNNTSALEAVHAAARLKDSRYPIAYDRGPNLLLPHLAKVKSLSQLLRAEALLASDAGQTSNAVNAVIDSFALARSLETEPLLISQLVRMACLSISCTSLERVLNQETLTEPDLTRIADALRLTLQASGPAFQAGFAGELCLGTFCFQAPAGEFGRWFDNDGNVPITLRLGYPLYGWTGLKDRDFFFYTRSMHRMLDNAKLPFPQQLQQARAFASEVEQGAGGGRLLVLSRMLLPTLQRSTEKTAELEARLRCAAGAVAIERWRVRNPGVVPQGLDQVPFTSEGVPRDPIDGAPLRYKKLDHGYVVYSVGLDGADNGGAERVSSAKSGARKRPPGGEGRANERAGTGYDVTFVVER